MGRPGAEHWTGTLYMRRISIYLTRLLLPTGISANGVTWLFIAVGIGGGGLLLIPGVVGALLAALAIQLQMMLDCSDGEVARWRGTFSPAGTYLDRVGHYSAEAALALALGLRAGGDWSAGGWTTLGALLALGLVLNRVENDLVHVARAYAGRPLVDGDAAAAAPRGGLVRRLRRWARVLPFYRAFHSIELTLLALAAGLFDALLGGLDATRVLMVALVVAVAVTLVGHLAAVLASSRLR
jgi:phosphatidylglycerophosphate synthase